MIITFIGIIVTIISMYQAYKYKKEAELHSKNAEKYKEQTYNLLKCIDLHSYAENLKSVNAEITRTPNKENNNRAGKLFPLFDRLTSILSEVTKYTAVLGKSEGTEIINAKRDLANKFLISNRALPTVNIIELSEVFLDLEEQLRNEIHNYQKRLK